MVGISRLLAFAAVSVLALNASVFAQEDVHDQVVKSYKLRPELAASFARDGAISPFWRSWDVANAGANVAMDYIDMTTTQNAWVTGGGSFSGPDDAALIVRSAYGANGLYLYLEVHDDNWQQPAGYETDALDFLLDKMNSQAIRDCSPFDCYISPSFGWSLTYYSIQYQISIGGGSVPSNIRINYFDGAAMFWPPEGTPMADLATTYGGMNVDVINVSANVKVMELYIPWTWVGTSGGVGSMPAEGADIAFAGGYNDLDAGQSTSARTALRWKEKDPFNTCNDMTPPHDYCDAWGDIQVVGDTVPTPPSSVRQPCRAPQTGLQAATAGSIYYNLKGERVSLSGTMQTSVLVKRTLSAGSKMKSEIVNIHP
jgi:hypothetical protein